VWLVGGRSSSAAGEGESEFRTPPKAIYGCFSGYGWEVSEKKREGVGKRRGQKEKEKRHASVSTRKNT